MGWSWGVNKVGEVGETLKVGCRGGEGEFVGVEVND